MMRALLYTPGGDPPIVVDIPAAESLVRLQKLVGGYIEAVAIGPSVVGYVNEDGIALGLPPTAYARTAGVIRGTMVVLGIEDTDERSLTEEEIELARRVVTPITPDNPLAKLRDRPR